MFSFGRYSSYSLCMKIVFPTQQSQSSESKQSHCPATKALGVVHQSMEFRVELSILGVRYRCQMDSSNESNGDKGMRAGAGVGYETVDPVSRGSVSGQLNRWCPGCVSSVAVVTKQKHVINAVMATVIARMRVWTVMAA